MSATRTPSSSPKGVWVVQGQPGRCNVYLIEDSELGGVTMYDAGARTMVRAVASAGAKLGGIKRIVLGHGHTDHRGTAPALDVPVLCHPDEVQDAEGSGGFRYWPKDLVGLPTPQRQIHRVMHRWAWDAGPVKISSTLSGGRRDRRLQGDRAARPRPRPDRAVARIGPPGARQRLLLHARNVGAQLPAARSRADLQLRHRAGEGLDPQAGGDGAGGGLAGARQACYRRRALTAAEGRRHVLSATHGRRSDTAGSSKRWVGAAARARATRS